MCVYMYIYLNVYVYNHKPIFLRSITFGLFSLIPYQITEWQSRQSEFVFTILPVPCGWCSCLTATFSYMYWYIFTCIHIYIYIYIYILIYTCIDIYSCATLMSLYCCWACEVYTFVNLLMFPFIFNFIRLYTRVFWYIIGASAYVSFFLSSFAQH